MKAIERIRKALRSADASLFDLREALDAIDIEALQADVTRAEQVRAGLLFDGTEKELAAEATLIIAIRDRDRGIAAKAELSKRITLATAAAAVEALTSERDKVEQKASALASRLAKQFVQSQIEIVGMLAELRQGEIDVQQVNQKLIEAGRSDLIAAIETRAFPVPSGLYAPAFSILKNEIRPVAGAPGWGASLPKA